MYKSAGWWQNIRQRIRQAFGKPGSDDSRVEDHFKKPDWNKFESRLDDGAFRKAVLKDARTDKKLKKFIDVQTAIRGNSSTGMNVMSSKGTQSYQVKHDKSLGRYTCTCNDFKYKQFDKSNGACKHIKKVKAEGGLKISEATIQSFGDEYAKLLDTDPDFAFLNDSAHVRALRQSRREMCREIDEIDGRLWTSADEPVAQSMQPGRSPTGEDYSEAISDLRSETDE